MLRIKKEILLFNMSLSLSLSSSTRLFFFHTQSLVCRLGLEEAATIESFLFLHRSSLRFASSGVGVHRLFKILLIASGLTLNNSLSLGTSRSGCWAWRVRIPAIASGDTFRLGSHCALLGGFVLWWGANLAGSDVASLCCILNF